MPQGLRSEAADFDVVLEPRERLAELVDRRKEKLSLVLYIAAIPLAFVNQWISDAIYVTVALIWLVPDRRIESILS